jgi:predicted porin
MYASLAYEQHTIGGAAGTTGVVGLNGNTIKESATKLGLGYTVADFSVGFAYEKTTDNIGNLLAVLVPAIPVGAVGSSVLGHSSYYLGGKYNVSANDTIKLAYTKAGNIDAGGIAAVASNTGASQFSLGYDHSLSKRTTVYAQYTQLSNQTAAGYALSTNGTGAPATIGAGAKPTAFSFGMKHTF